MIQKWFARSERIWNEGWWKLEKIPKNCLNYHKYSLVWDGLTHVLLQSREWLRSHLMPSGSAYIQFFPLTCTEQEKGIQVNWRRQLFFTIILKASFVILSLFYWWKWVCTSSPELPFAKWKWLENINKSVLIDAEGRQLIKRDIKLAFKKEREKQCVSEWVNKWMTKKVSKYLWKALLFKTYDFLFQGDSGSPLICDNVFRGVTSFGKCGNPQKPGIYILLTKKYLNWIKKTIAGAI